MFDMYFPNSFNLKSLGPCCRATVGMVYNVAVQRNLTSRDAGMMAFVATSFKIQLCELF